MVNCSNWQELPNKSFLGKAPWRWKDEGISGSDRKALVDHPEEVTVTETEKDNATVVELRVSPTDMGKVIGKQGRIAKAIRSVVKAAASRDDKKVIVEIVQ